MSSTVMSISEHFTSALADDPSEELENFTQSPTNHSAEDLGDGHYFVTGSPIMQRLRAEVARVAAVDVPVLLHGESGVGKEVFARLIHKLSPRSQHTFLKVNCAALPADLLESELFGYEPGAFTGATRSKPGKFELCNKGTILLDEIGEMPPCLQAKLLQVLQDRQFSRLGGRTVLTVDVRILAATNIDIQQALDTKRLRPDLYYRLGAFSVHVPPLRDRKEDLPVMLQLFMERWAKPLGRSPRIIPPHVLNACMHHSWPGNVRELENFVKRFLLLENAEAALLELVRKNGNENGNGHGNCEVLHFDLGHCALPSRVSDLKTVVRTVKAEVEREAITQALEESQGSRKEAARILNISGKALLYKLRQYGMIDTMEMGPDVA